MMVTLVTEEGENHAVVVSKIGKRKVTILDPDKGIYRLPLKEFIHLWDGTALIIEADNGSNKPLIINEPNKKKDYALSIILQMVSGIFCIFGVYFINNSSYWWLSLIAFCLFVIVSLIKKVVVFKSMRKIDDFYIDNLKIKRKDYRRFFVRLEEYKKQSLVNPISFATNFFIVAFLTYIVISNSLWNVFLVVVPLLLAFLNHSFINPRLKREEKSIANEEIKLETVEGIQEYKCKSKLIHQNAYSLGKEMIAVRYLNIFVLVISALILILCHGEYALTQTVFYVVVQQVLFDYISRLFSYSQKEKEYSLAKARLINVIHQKDENN